MYEFEVRASSLASPEQVWPLLVDANRWPAWTGLPDPTMDRRGNPEPWGLGSIRRFSWGPVYVQEEVVVWDPPGRYGYAVVGGMPLRGYRATVTLTETVAGTAIVWAGGFDRATVPGLARPLLWFTRTMLGKYARRLGEHAAAVARRA